MPEGDTLHRIAARIGPALAGRTVSRLALADRGDVEEARGWRIDDVRALGKHLLIGFDSGWTLRTHLGMDGRVFVVAAGRRDPRSPTFLLRVAPGPATLDGPPRREGAVACARAYRAELIRTADLRRHARLARLGPDLLADPPDLDGVVARALAPAFGAREIADVLLDQRIGSGIGNVYKSEVLFMERIHPRTPMSALAPDDVRRVYARAAELLRRNLRTRRRTTVPTRRRPHPNSPRLWVYERGGEACLECGTPIVRFTQGDMARGTWMCPRCQPGPTVSRP
jgi:endonuclease-8